ncbi:MAG TPA: nucleotidyltransferase family protein [Thermoguttaceae bacterium]|nr:nucleotidyltransferase family protein [Thermoguttaceae bacterium]
MDRMVNPSLQTLLETAKRCHDLFDAADIPHVVIGGIAVYLHGYKRNSRDVDLLVRRDERDGIRQALESAGYSWDARRKAYISPTNVRVDFRYAGEDAGNGKVLFPDPATLQAREIINDLPALALTHLIEAKLACAIAEQREGKGRGRHKKHCVDVVQLIATNGLTGSYAEGLHESVRAEFRRVAVQASGP